MKSISIPILFIVICLVSAIFFTLSCQNTRNDETSVVWDIVSENIHQLDKYVQDTLITALESGEQDQCLQAFTRTRYLYKEVEPAIEYFLPGTAKGINGAAIPEVEPGDNTQNEPTGLQVMEELLYGEKDSTTRESLLFQAKNIRSFLYRARQIWDVQQPNRFQYVDAIYMAFIRIAAMGITGFDIPDSKSSLGESAAVLTASKRWLLALAIEPDDSAKNLLSDIEKACKYLNDHKADFNGFNRAEFIRKYWQPAFAKLAAIREPLINAHERYAIKPSARNLFGRDALNLDFFSPDSLKVTPEKLALGEALFYDTRLSKNNRFSCATCHQPEKYFTDQIALNENIHGNPLERNTPTLLNAAFQSSYFWDMRAWNLELQAKAVIDNALEMHGSLDSVCQQLNKDEKLLSEFRQAYGSMNMDINGASVTSLLALYQRSLTGLNSPFDRYMLGEENIIPEDAINGFNLFMGKAKCGTCHFIPLFSGLVPPAFDRMESEIIGVPANAKNSTLHKDSGRYHINPVPAYLHAFKTPTVRNASGTFPYMHNGIYQTLEQVMEFYNLGGGEGLGYAVPGQTLPADPLELSKEEIASIIVFLNQLSDEFPAIKKG